MVGSLYPFVVVKRKRKRKEERMGKKGNRTKKFKRKKGENDQVHEF